MKRLVRDERGSAVTEGVVVAFFLAILFGFAMFEYRLHRTEETEGLTVRSAVEGAAFLRQPGGAPDEVRRAYLAPVWDRWEQWVPERAAMLDTVRDGSVRRSRDAALARPQYLGSGLVQMHFESTRATDEHVRGGSGGNWPAMFDTWCRVGMCSGSAAGGPEAWDHGGDR